MPSPTSDLLSVLLVEDSAADQRWVAEKLGESVQLSIATSLREAHQIGEVDVALLDLNLEESVGLETIKKFRRGFPHVPVVVLTRIADAEIEAACLDLGAHAVYSKREFSVIALVKSMEAAVIRWRDRARDSGERETHKGSLRDLLAMTKRLHDRLAALDRRPVNETHGE